MDYEALAKQFGGAAATTGSVPADYEALAKQFGGATTTAPVGEGIPSSRAPDTSAAQIIGVANRALAPYATAAGAGALAGAPFMGVGAPIGAAMGVTALGLGDIGTSLYNLGAGAFGGRRVPLPSETIQDVYGSFGIGRKPETPGQQVLANTLAAATGAGSQARALNALAPYARGPVTQNVMRELGTQPGAQAAAGGGAAAVPSILEQQGVTDPFALAASSVAGGLAGGKVAGAAGRRAQTFESSMARTYDKLTGQKTATTEGLKAAADAAYKKADASGITFTPNSYSKLVDDVNDTLKQEGFDPDLSDRVAKAVRVLENRRNQPQSLTEIDNVRKIVSQLKMDPDPNTRRLAGVVVDKIDDFVTKSGSNAISSGTPEGIAALNEGRSMWSRMSKSSVIEDILDKADLSAADAADTIRTRFAVLARNDKRMRRFNEGERAAIRNIAEGKSTPTTLNIISRLAPGLDLRGLLMGGALAGGAYYSEGISPEEVAALGALGLGARAGRNYLTKRTVSNLASGIRRGDIPAPYAVQPNALVSPISQQFLNSLATQTGQ